MDEAHIKLFSDTLTQVLSRGKTQNNKDVGSLCLRILISGRKSFVYDLHQQSNLSEIDLATSNHDDIEKFVLDGKSPLLAIY